MELAFPEGDCICSVSIGRVDLLLGGGCLKAMRLELFAGKKAFVFHRIFRTGAKGF